MTAWMDLGLRKDRLEEEFEMEEPNGRSELDVISVVQQERMVTWAKTKAVGSG